jgi:hypothetical protein
VWEKVDLQTHTEFVAYLLKLLASPFFRKIQNRSQTAPTLARKVAESNILLMCRDVITMFP